MLFYLLNRWLLGEPGKRDRVEELEERLREQERRQEALQAEFTAFRDREADYLNLMRDRLNLVTQSQQTLAGYLIALRKRQEELGRESPREARPRLLAPAESPSRKLGMLDKRLARLGYHVDRLADRITAVEAVRWEKESRRGPPGAMPAFLRRGSANPAKQNEVLANIFRSNLELQKGIVSAEIPAETRKMASSFPGRTG